MAAFATSADMVDRYDVRTLGDLCSDDGTRATEISLASNDPMTTALNSATGEIKAAVLRAERYTLNELESLVGDARDFLVDLVCQVAFWKLIRRKPYADNEEYAPSKQRSDDSIELLRRGDHVFDITRQQDAGTPKIIGVTRVNAANKWSLFVDQARGRHYPRRRTYNNR